MLTLREKKLQEAIEREEREIEEIVKKNKAPLREEEQVEDEEQEEELDAYEPDDEEQDEDEAPIVRKPKKKEQPEEAEGESPNPSKDNYEKRFKDAQRYITELSQKVKRLEESAKNPKLPVQPEKIKEWMEKNPISMEILKKIVAEEAQEVREKVRKVEAKLTRREAEELLGRMHPDFRELRNDQKFHDWVEKQNPTISEIVYAKGNFDVSKIAWVLDLYKERAGSKKPDTTGAEMVSTRGDRTSTQIDSKTRKYDFSESQVAAMSDEEFEKNEEAILKAQKEGRFKYDLRKR